MNPLDLTGGQGLGFPGHMATNEEIAGKIGLTHSGVSRIRSGNRVPGSWS